MTIETLRHFFGWCSLINYVILLLWLFIYLFLKPMLFGVASRLFKMSDEQTRVATYTGMSYFKMGIMLFNLAPYIALRLMS